MRTKCIVVGLLVGMLCAAWGQAPPPPPDTSRYLYLLPEWADRVVYYQSFARDAKSPEINTGQLQVNGSVLPPVAGFVGAGYTCPNSREGQQDFTLRGAALTVQKPLTVMYWFRLDAPMTEITNFSLIRLIGTGYIANFVRGKGEWCALQYPTSIMQVYNFPGITNRTDPWDKRRVDFVAGTWHHVAMTVSNAAEIDVYWDGQLRTRHVAKGRSFHDGDVNQALLGCGGLYHPMTLDDVIVIDRALTADELADYQRACDGMRTLGFPVADQ